MFSDIDMVFPEAGPMVIENNLKLVFLAGKEKEGLEAAMERFLVSVAG
jgi:hypothetical protein